MTAPQDERNKGYDQPYADYDSPLKRQLRHEAYGEDIGQHSWVTVAELRSDIERLGLSSSSVLLDLGCGPGGPLAFVLKAIGCSGTGLDVSGSAIDAARCRAVSLGVDKQLTVGQADMNAPLPLPNKAFGAVVSLDVILHARDRLSVFREVARVLMPGGRFLFTDAGVLTGSISNDEAAARSVHGFTQFCPPGYNERMLAAAGLALICTEDRTASLLGNATGRIAAMDAHRAELEQLEGVEYFARQRSYLETVVALSRRGVLARVMYFCEVTA